MMRDHTSYKEDTVLFMRDYHWRNGHGTEDVYYYISATNDYHSIGKIVRETNEQKISTYTALGADGKRLLPPSRKVKPVIEYYQENGREIWQQRQKEMKEQLLKELRQGKNKNRGIER